jgi:hypothetical protein
MPNDANHGSPPPAGTEIVAAVGHAGLCRQEFGRDVLLLDHTTNGEVTNSATPLSHAALVRLYLQNEWPDEDDQSERTA